MSGKTKINMGRHYKALVFSCVILVMLGSTPTGMLYAFSATTALVEGNSDSETLQKLKIASMQHDLILLLIESKDFAKVESEWRKVLDLGLSAKYEGAVAQSLLTISYKLTEAKQLSIALAILDDSLSIAPFSNKSRAEILKLKAYIYKEAGDLDSAIDTLRQASELAEKP
jgi:tetratricopeptide (TPR) repeat protein